MEIRECRDQDWEQVWDLWEICRVVLPPGCRCSRTVKCCGQNPFALVAEASGIVLGSANGTWDGERGWICSVAVDPRLRRTGVARQLLQELENRLRDRGATYIATLVPRDNLEAQMVFEAIGFGPVASHVVMGKSLQ